MYTLPKTPIFVGSFTGSGEAENAFACPSDCLIVVRCVGASILGAVTDTIGLLDQFGNSLWFIQGTGTEVQTTTIERTYIVLSPDGALTALAAGAPSAWAISLYGDLYPQTGS